jgi:CRISPR-associated endonuclease/helicase Cas3
VLRSLRRCCEKIEVMMEEPVLAHRSEDGKREQTLADHLQATARIAGEFAAAFGAENWGRAAGLLHDDGKASPEFQGRIRGASIRVDHSTPGAKYAVERFAAPKGFGKLIAYCVAGHHTGLPNGNEGGDESCLNRRLMRSRSGTGFLSAQLPLSLEVPPIERLPAAADRRGFSAAFFTRMLYSCLVDADYLDTEYFLNPQNAEKRGNSPSLTDLRPLLRKHLSAIADSAEPTDVNRLRARILAECQTAAKLGPGLFSLTVPTGGGKTLSSLAFAIQHAILHDLRRVIYVIPYTSIIEQTARVFRDILGNDAVLEHHSNFIQEKDQKDDEAEEQRRLAAENWDAPIVVTTNVQFFESFFANRSSRTRKLHNVARSVVILDEAQMLPVPLLKPTLEVIRELVSHYRTSVVLCTATQPALMASDEFESGLAGAREMMSEPLHLEKAFKRVHENQLGIVKDDDLIRRIRANDRCLCVVNTRKHARELFHALEATEGSFHLSAGMCPVHRSKVLGDHKDPAEGTIRQRLRDGKSCRVISTQLVEAGVDLDFPAVIRAMAGIDSLVQAAGRCNREGKMAEGGQLYVFTPEEGLPAGHFRQSAQMAELVLRGRNGRILDSETVHAYFKELYWMKDQGDGLDSPRVMSLFESAAMSGDFPFRTVAELYRLIPDAQIPVIVPFDESAKELCEALRWNTSPGSLLRQLQPYTIQVYPSVLAKLIEAGDVEGLQDNRYYVLTELGMKNSYDEHFGLNPIERDFLNPVDLMS